MHTGFVIYEGNCGSVVNSDWVYDLEIISYQSFVLF